MKMEDLKIRYKSNNWEYRSFWALIMFASAILLIILK